jgi:hypothetical protein
VVVDNGNTDEYLAAPGSEWRPDQADWSSQEYTVTTSSIFGIVKAADNEPRFDHDSAGVCRGLLIEEGRTNICLRSENFGTTWSTFNSDTSLISQVAPNGDPSAYSLVENTSTNAHSVFQSIAFAGTTNYTFSVFVKAGSRNFASLVEQSSGGTVRRTFFNLSTGEVGTKNASHTASTQQLPNGWWRLIISFTSGTASNANIAIELASADNVASYLGNGSGNAFIWGAQLEAGSFATSYIPTTTGTLARGADVCNITGGNFNNFYNQSEGTAVTKVTNAAGIGSFTQYPFSFSGSSATELLIVYRSGSAAITPRACRFGSVVLNNDTLSDSPDAGVFADNAISIAGFAIKLNDFAGSLNGNLITDTTVSLPAVDRMFIGNRVDGTRTWNGHIAYIRYYKKRLPNAKLQALTA